MYACVYAVVIIIVLENRSKVGVAIMGDSDLPLEDIDRYKIVHSNFSMLRICSGHSIAELHLEKQIFPSQRQDSRLITQYRNVQYNFATYHI